LGTHGSLLHSKDHDSRRKREGDDYENDTNPRVLLREETEGVAWSRTTRKSNTLSLLAAQGIKYIGDWVNDDQPYRMKTEDGDLVSLPYSLEVNDIPINLLQHQSLDGIYNIGKDQLDILYSESKRIKRIMAIAFHPYISGQPHRSKYLDRLLGYIKGHEGVIFMKGEDIYDWYVRTERNVVT